MAELEFFGEQAVVESEPFTMSVGALESSFDFPDGTTVEVPAGAFPDATELTAAVVTLNFAAVAEDARPGRIYVLSTAGDVDLAEPVVLEVPRPSSEVQLTQLVDGEWRRIDVPDGATTRVPITGFSTVPTAVVELADEAPVLRGAKPSGESPADFLALCIGVVSIVLGDVERDGDSAALDIAYSFCARSLVSRFSPSGVRVEVGCVRDKIGCGLDFQPAIDECVAEQPSEDEPAVDSVERTNDGTVEVGQPSDTSAGSQNEEADGSGIVESGNTSWEESLTPRADLPDTAWDRSLSYLGGDVLIFRDEGTDDFEIDAVIDIDRWTKWALSEEAFLELGTFDPNWCETSTSELFSGTGTFETDAGGRLWIVFNGEMTNSDTFESCDLEQLPPFDDRRPSTLWVEVTESGLTGTFQGHDFTLSGAALPVGS